MEFGYLDERCQSALRQVADRNDFDMGEFAKWAESVGLEGKRNPSAYFTICFRDKLEKGEFAKKETRLDLDIPLSLSEEIEMEENDKRQFIELDGLFGEQHPAEPNEPRFGKHPSIFDTSQYQGRDEYKRNTWISVWRDAKARNTSMHQICRERGLEYEMLIW